MKPATPAGVTFVHALRQRETLVALLKMIGIDRCIAETTRCVLIVLAIQPAELSQRVPPEFFRAGGRISGDPRLKGVFVRDGFEPSTNGLSGRSSAS